jgi:hypothetical protein
MNICGVFDKDFEGGRTPWNTSVRGPLDDQLVGLQNSSKLTNRRLAEHVEKNGGNWVDTTSEGTHIHSHIHTNTRTHKRGKLWYHLTLTIESAI